MPEAPRAELLRGLAVFAEAPGPSHAAIAEALGLPGVPSAAEYSDVFLFQLYPYASVHLGTEGMMGGEARDRVAGFWRALALSPPAEPDHLAALVGLYASLCEQEALAEEESEALLLARARGALVDEHLAPWLFLFLARMQELAGPVYSGWADVLARTFIAEVESVGASEGAIAAHLRAVDPLPDPREDGSGPFLDAIFATARLGALLTRADLAAVSAELDIGLRAGERRYALEHLLAQDAAGVLGALARETSRQAGIHRANAERLGGRVTVAARTISELADRADSSARLLEALSTESAELLARAPGS